MLQIMVWVVMEDDSSIIQSITMEKNLHEEIN